MIGQLKKQSIFEKLFISYNWRIWSKSYNNVFKYHCCSVTCLEKYGEFSLIMQWLSCYRALSVRR